jgi:hypothetical protein
MALGLHEYPSHFPSVLSFPKTVVYRGVLMLMPLTVYLTRYHGNDSRRHFVSRLAQEGSINRSKYRRSGSGGELMIRGSMLNARASEIG